MDVFWAAFGGGAAAGIVTLLSVLLIEFTRWRLSQPKLRVSFTLGAVLEPGGSPKRAMFFSAYNGRSTPVTITSIGLSASPKSKGHQIVGIRRDMELPKELTAGGQFDTWVELDDLIPQFARLGTTVGDMKHAYVTAHGAKIFSTKISKSFKKEMEAEATRSSGKR